MNDAELGLKAAQNEFKSELAKLIRAQNDVWTSAVMSSLPRFLNKEYRHALTT